MLLPAIIDTLWRAKKCKLLCICTWLHDPHGCMTIPHGCMTIAHGCMTIPHGCIIIAHGCMTIAHGCMTIFEWYITAFHSLKLSDSISIAFMINSDQIVMIAIAS